MEISPRGERAIKRKMIKSIASVVLVMFCGLLLEGCIPTTQVGTEAKLELAIKYLSENKYEVGDEKNEES